MDTFDYKSNSHKSRTEKEAAPETKRVDRVIRDNVTIKKKSEVAKLGDTLKDGFKDAKTYLFNDVLIPSFKDLVVDLVTKGINILVRGSASEKGKRNVLDKVSYNRYWNKPDRRDVEVATRSRFDYDEIEFPTRGAAETVLDALSDIIETYGVARVADLYDAIGVSCEYTYQNYGWTSLATAKVVPSRDGYVLDMPRALPIHR